MVLCVIVSTLEFESKNPSASLGRTLLSNKHVLVNQYEPYEEGHVEPCVGYYSKVFTC